MAFTEQNKADAYLFFALAFNAAPGTVYGGQIVAAYEAGATTQQIVNTYTTKEEFTKLYPTTDTNAEFANKLVSNVVGATATAAVKAQAEADIVAALAAGLTKGDVIFAVLGNLSKMDTANADWGKTVAMINNKIAVAKALTEGPLALNTTDVDALQGPLAGVTDDVGTVTDAINGAGSLADKIDALKAAQKALADFVKENATVAADAAAAVVVVEGPAELDDFGFSNIVAGVETVSAATQSTIIATAKQKNADALAAANKGLNDAKDAFLAANPGSLTKLNAYLKAGAADTAAQTALDAADAAQLKLETALGKAIADPAPVVAVDGDTGVATAGGAPVITVQAGKLAVDPAFAAGASEESLKAAQDLLAGIVAQQSAEAAKAVTAKALADADTALGGDTTAVDNAATALATAQKNVTDLDAALKAYNDAMALLNKQTGLEKAVADAVTAIENAGMEAPKVIDNVVAGTADKDLFLVNADSKGDALGSFGAGDKIYVGKGYVLNADLAKGDATKLEVFFEDTGANVVVHIEQNAFDSNATGTPDVIEVTLTGVASVDDLVFKDGFISLVAA